MPPVYIKPDLTGYSSLLLGIIFSRNIIYSNQFKQNKIIKEY